MSPVVLYLAYLAVMGSAGVCFTLAYRRRFDTPRHMRVALVGFSLALTGTVAVLVLYRVLGWVIPARHEEVVYWHRRCAYVATGTLLLVALSGWRRWRVHPRLAVAFLPLFAVTLALAVVGYWPF